MPATQIRLQVVACVSCLYCLSVHTNIHTDTHTQTDRHARLLCVRVVFLQAASADLANIMSCHDNMYNFELSPNAASPVTPGFQYAQSLSLGTFAHANHHHGHHVQHHQQEQYHQQVLSQTSVTASNWGDASCYSHAPQTLCMSPEQYSPPAHPPAALTHHQHVNMPAATSYLSTISCADQCPLFGFSQLQQNPLPRADSSTCCWPAAGGVSASCQQEDSRTAAYMTHTATGGVRGATAAIGGGGGKAPIKRVSNRKERRRTMSINNAFSELRECIPNVPADTKLSKIKTLRLATSYIAYLSGILQSDAEAVPEFKAEIKKTDRHDERRKRELALILEQERKSHGRTGWPQHVWALELKP